MLVLCDLFKTKSHGLGRIYDRTLSAILHLSFDLKRIVDQLPDRQSHLLPPWLIEPPNSKSLIESLTLIKSLLFVDSCVGSAENKDGFGGQIWSMSCWGLTRLPKLEPDEAREKGKQAQCRSALVTCALNPDLV